MHPVALGVVAAAAMSATTAVAQTRLVTEEMMVKSPEPRIEIYRCRRQPSTSWSSTSRLRKRLASPSRSPSCRLPTRWSN